MWGQGRCIAWIMLLVAVATSGSADAQDPRLLSYALRYNDTPGAYIVGVWTVPGNFTNTGLAYDPDRHLIYCSHLSFVAAEECIETLRRSDGARAAQPVAVRPWTALIQGLTYDRTDGSLLVWGGDVPYDDKVVCRFDTAGAFLGSFPLPGYPGSLELHQERRMLLAKACNDPWIRIHSLGGELIDQFYGAYGGEGLAFDPIDDSYWVLTESRLYHLRRQQNTCVILGDYPNPTRFYPPDTLAGYWEDGEAEGIVVDPSDRTLWLNADQTYHGGIPGGNRCWHIDPLGTHDRSVRIPGGPSWSVGWREHLRIEADGLALEAGWAEGVFITPVIDLGLYRMLGDSVAFAGDGEVEVAVRGSQQPPTTPAIDHLTRPYHDANQLNLGWGLTQPGAWQAAPIQGRFVQMRVTIRRGGAGAPGIGGRGPRLVTATPNPFTRELRLDFAGGASGAHCEVFDANGRRVREFSGAWWDGRDAAGRPAGAGTYLVRWRAGGAAQGSLRVVRLGR